jgi:hypothetical protein
MIGPFSRYERSRLTAFLVGLAFFSGTGFLIGLLLLLMSFSGPRPIDITTSQIVRLRPQNGRYAVIDGVIDQTTKFRGQSDGYYTDNKGRHPYLSNDYWFALYKSGQSKRATVNLLFFGQISSPTELPSGMARSLTGPEQQFLHGSRIKFAETATVIDQTAIITPSFGITVILVSLGLMLQSIRGLIKIGRMPRSTFLGA